MEIKTLCIEEGTKDVKPSMNSSINVCSSGQFYIGSIEILKNLYLETFFVHFELSTKRNHVNLYQFECIIKPQYLFNRIILKIQGLM